jgi:ABC-type transport system involved in multi-copper enzyme maturation permease subunit
MTALVTTELRRALARRAVRLLIAIALIAIVLTAVLVYVHATDPPTGFRLVQTWDGSDDSFLLTPALLLIIGGLIGGATVTGAEWRAGTVLGLLTWEPRRHRVLAARAIAVAALAAAVSFVLLVLFVLALLPGASRGSTVGVDGPWLAALVRAMLRISAVTAASALVGACIASIGRNTAAALGAAFAYMVVIENVIRGVRPGWARWGLIETIGSAVLGHPLEATGQHMNSALTGALVLALYVAIVLAIAFADFVRRDVA